MFFKIIFIALMAFAVSEEVSYRDYKVFKTVPKTTEQLEALKSLNERLDYDFWTDAMKIDTDVRVMVSPAQTEEFLDYLKKYEMYSEIAIADVQKFIDAQRIPASIRSAAFRNAGSMTWDRYYEVDAINEWLDELPSLFPGVVETVVMGNSNSGREMKGVIIDFHPEIIGSGKLIGMFEGGIHAREWISPATLTWVIREFLTSTDPGVRSMAESFQWHIFPVVNPDGYDYTFRSNRLWRKNRNYNHTTNCAPFGIADDISNGIDLNRNFDFVWMSTGASDNACSETYAGWAAFSEPESRAIANYVLRLHSQGNMIYYISFHSYSQLLLVPYSHLEGAAVIEADNYADMFEIGIRAMDALRARHGTDYITGTSSDILYPVSGGSFDWVKGTGVPIVFLYEVRDIGPYGFLLPPSQIIPNGEEVVDSLVEMHTVAQQMGYYTADASAVVSSFVLIAVTAILAWNL